jgi:enoyl-CoA hydratase/3-hydroxyacyl-CoA dehydrogenase
MAQLSFKNPLAKKPTVSLPKAVAIIGAGTIGPDIGYYLLTSVPGLELTLVDVVPQALEKAVERLKGYAQKGLAKGKLSAEQAEAVATKLKTTTDVSSIGNCDWVLEAATENLDLKKKIFAQVESVVRPDAMITSNTSSIPAARLFSALKHPERATVTHFFAPAYKNPAVEVVSWNKVDASVVERLRWVFCQTGKVPMVTSDAVCFMLDRVFDNWCNESALLLGGATASEVDSVANEFVHAGPFFVLNLARGNPIIVETNTLQMEEGAHYRPADIFRSVDTWKTIGPGKTVAVQPKVAGTIRDRLLGSLFSQSVDIVDRAIGDAADLNLGCQLALGFKDGPFDLMAKSGAPETERIFKVLATERAGMPLPSRKVGAYQDFLRTVMVDDVEGVKLLTLRRPQAMNALDDRTTDELLAVVKRFEHDAAVKGFVIIGYGTKAFCAGADIGRFPDLLGRAEAAAQFARDCSRLLVHLDTMDKPIVAALNGMALGGGLELALRCHGLVAMKEAFMQFPEVTLGIAAGIGGMVVPYRRWPNAASDFHSMLLHGTRLKAVKAKELGIVDAMAGSYEELVSLAVERVLALGGKVKRIPDAPVAIPALPEGHQSAVGQVLSRQAVQLIGAAIKEAAAAKSFAIALEVGYLAFGTTACTSAAREGVTAFLERRKADFETSG